jgi:chemotaxis signal transduction protein
LDLRACLAIGGKIPPQRKMLVIDSKEAKGGLLVDRMVELQTIDERKMQYIIYPTELRRGIVVIRHAFYASKLLQCIDYTQILKSAVTSGVPTSHL